VRGTLGSDTVTMGGFTVSPQTFLTVDAMTSGLVDAPVSGLMGLAFQSLASTQAVPFWLALTNSSQLNNPEMSFWLGRDANPANTTVLVQEGVFTLGGTNSSLYSGDISFSDIALPGSFWLLPLTSLTVNGAAVTLSTVNPSSAIDTGTTLIGGPHADIVAFYGAISGSSALLDQPGMYSFPCSKSVSVSMAFGGGKSWAISPSDFNVGPLGQGQCLGALFDLSQGSNIPPDSGNPPWVVGDTFLKNVYTVFRSSPASVGFAQLSTAAGGSGTATAGSSSPSGSSTSGSTSGSPSAAMSTIAPAFFMLTTAFTTAIMFCL